MNKYKGKTRIKVSLIDNIEKIKIDMPSKNPGVELTNELLLELEQMEEYLDFDFVL